MTNEAGVHKKGTFSLQDMMKDIKDKENFQKAGAIALFIGVARGETLKGEKVQQLELEAYKEKADEVLEGICRDMKAKKGIVDVRIHHLTGKFEVGEDLVYVLVAGAHRKDVFPVLQKAVDRYKKEAPIFKKEYITTKEGQASAYWVT